MFTAHCGFTPPLARQKGRGWRVWASVRTLAFFDIVGWKDWNKDKILHLRCKETYHWKLFVIS